MHVPVQALPCSFSFVFFSQSFPHILLISILHTHVHINYKTKGKDSSSSGSVCVCVGVGTPFVFNPPTKLLLSLPPS